MQKLVRLQTLTNEWSTCQKCQLLCHGRKSVVFGYGQYERIPLCDPGTGQQIGFGGQVMIIGEAPGSQEDEKGVPFVGKSGMLLNRYLASVSARRDIKDALRRLDEASDYEGEQALDYALRQLLCQEFFFTNVIACRPPENRDPIPQEVAACQPRLTETIYTVDPIMIIATGRIAVEALIHKKVSITQIRGQLYDVTIPGKLMETCSYPMIAVLHPSYLMRKNDFNQKAGDGAKTFRDFLKAMHVVDDYNFRNFGIPHPKRDEQD